MADLQRALVHLITASLAAPPNTTNLWCLLFNPDHLTGSYLPGFMVSIEYAIIVRLSSQANNKKIIINFS